MILIFQEQDNSFDRKNITTMFDAIDKVESLTGLYLQVKTEILHVPMQQVVLVQYIEPVQTLMISVGAKWIHRVRLYKVFLAEKLAFVSVDQSC